MARSLGMLIPCRSRSCNCVVSHVFGAARSDCRVRAVFRFYICPFVRFCFFTFVRPYLIRSVIGRSVGPSTYVSIRPFVRQSSLSLSPSVLFPVLISVFRSPRDWRTSAGVRRPTYRFTRSRVSIRTRASFIVYARPRTCMRSRVRVHFLRVSAHCRLFIF